MNRAGDVVRRFGSLEGPVTYLRACPECDVLIQWLAMPRKLGSMFDETLVPTPMHKCAPRLETHVAS